VDGDWTQRGESKSVHCDSRFGGSWQVGKRTEEKEQDATFVCSWSDTKGPRASGRGNKPYGLVRSCDFTADMDVMRIFQIILILSSRYPLSNIAVSTKLLRLDENKIEAEDSRRACVSLEIWIFVSL
jgi:hypothetical protein